jgi:hypothetical protein
MEAKSGKVYCYDLKTDPHKTLIEVKQKPEKVCLLLDREKFFKYKGLMFHHDTIFLLDLIHDYEYVEKQGRKYIRVYGSYDPEDPLPILIVYELKRG